MFTAHIREPGNEKQSVKEHSENVSALAGEFLRSCGLFETGKLAGLLHDAGKLRAVFDDYINKRNNMRRGSIDHSYAGARYLKELAENKDPKIKAAAAGIAHTILSHHGISDWLDSDGNDEYQRRTSKNDDYEEICSNISDIIPEQMADEMLSAAAEEWLNIAGKLMRLAKGEDAKREAAFYIGMLERLIQSALIDADRTDTADFMSGRATEHEPDRAGLWMNMDKRMDEMLAAFSKLTDSISVQRRSISDRCAAFAEHKVGACRLIVPTGGGKTLSSLRFAIKHCKKYGLKRIIYIAPFMSILEQNSDIIASIAGEENFLEHHSNMVSEIDNTKELEDYLLCAERWDKPVIATTMVQFLNTLFSAKTSSVRRMHRLCDSVIIIDEVQSVPIRCTDLFSLAVNFLVDQCNASVVLCSATQPPFDERKSYRLLLDEEKDMAGDRTKDFEVFRRTEIIPQLKKYGYDTEEAVGFCSEKFRENGDLLLIVNTKAQAKEMYEKLREQLGSEAYLIHLSTNMCPAHRKKRIGTLRRFLKRNMPVVCVTTQLIEAGVDISFRCVVRAIAGLDNAAQAAGRCNRSGEYNRICPVYLINFKSENLSRLEEIKSAQDISRHIIDNGDDDLLSVDVQSRYFNMLFERYKNELSYNVKDGSQDSSILEFLSTNKGRWIVRQKTEPIISQAFRTAGELFEVIDSRTKNIIVPYNKQARDIIAKLESDISPQETVELLRKAQKYTVSIYSGTEKRLIEKGALDLNTLDKRFYSNEFGVTLEGAEQEVLIF
ncbi:MAG TPA: CRISPR-associated helicase Cas3' [Ruminococcus sp.]|nr:CRISPR-associated helicase Cas3' [Ruminococcus sp.]